MYIIPNLGGGIGNRLFEYAAAAGLAERWGWKVAFAPTYTHANSHGRPTTIFDLFPSVPIEDIGGTRVQEFLEKEGDLFTFVPFTVKPPADISAVVLKGYFQTPLYFPKTGITPDWVSALGPEGMSIVEKRANLTDPAVRAKTWFIHFRQGDYRVLPHHQEDLTRYYMKCLYAVPNGSKLHCFSDEPDRCKEFLTAIVEGRNLEITWSKSVADIEALYEMSLCQAGAIVANSTFSWWGAYFARASNDKFQAFYPAAWGAGLPPPLDVVPSWGEKVTLD